MNNYFIKTFKDKIRPPFYQVWLGWLVGSILTILCNCINISTLCFWRPFWDYKFIIWTQNRIKQVKLDHLAEQVMEQQQKAVEEIFDSEKKILNDLEQGKPEQSDHKNIFS